MFVCTSQDSEQKNHGRCWWRCLHWPENSKQNKNQQLVSSSDHLLILTLFRASCCFQVSSTHLPALPKDRCLCRVVEAELVHSSQGDHWSWRHTSALWVTCWAQSDAWTMEVCVLAAVSEGGGTSNSVSVYLKFIFKKMEVSVCEKHHVEMQIITDLHTCYMLNKWIEGGSYWWLHDPPCLKICTISWWTRTYILSYLHQTNWSQG